MDRPTDRRMFLQRSLGLGAAAALGGTLPAKVSGAPETTVVNQAPLYKISLAEWSFHRTLSAGKLDHLDFAKTANNLGIDAAEYVNQFFKDKARDKTYLADMKTRAAGEGVYSVLIMIDGEGRLGDPDDAKRTQAIENHHQWVEAAAYLGCHSIRVNAGSRGSYDEQMKLAADGLRRLTEFAAPYGISVIVENHGGLSSNGAWLAQVMKTVDHPRCGTLPDFGNFRVSRDEVYDRYKGVGELMPFAKSVSAKSHAFDADGNEKEIDYVRMMKIVVAAGYHGYVGVEWEGSDPGEIDGVLLTKKLLLRVRDQLSAA